MRKRIKDPSNIWVVRYVDEDSDVINGSVTQVCIREQSGKLEGLQNNGSIVFTSSDDYVTYVTKDNKYKNFYAVSHYIFNDKSSAISALLKMLKRNKKSLDDRLTKLQNRHNKLTQRITKLEQELCNE